MEYKLCLFFLFFSLVQGLSCIHDHFTRNTTHRYYNDLEGRVLAEVTREKMRIFMDYSHLEATGDQTSINVIKRIMNISANYYYNTLKVNRLEKLYFPSEQALKCNILPVPQRYVKQGTIGDLGILVGAESSKNQYVAKSTSCVLLESNNRPIWGMVFWNKNFLKFDQHGFQQILFVGMHELFHVIGFSAQLYDKFPAGNPFKEVNKIQYLSSEKINKEISAHYNCANGLGMPLEDQDGSNVSSHWERKVVGNEFMIASSKKGSYVSNISLALMDSTGWYTVNYDYAEPTTWGQAGSCQFLNPENCGFDEFCTHDSLACDWQGTGIGACAVDTFGGSCKITGYYTNTICYDPNYELKNLNSQLKALERGGDDSRCFNSDFRQAGLQANKLNSRCYTTVCSYLKNRLFLLVGEYILLCFAPGQIIQAPSSLEGTLTCPKNFDNYCKQKQTCPYHCNKNGACINGKCLCTGKTSLSSSCLDEEITKSPVGTMGGLLKSIRDPLSGQILTFSRRDQNTLSKNTLTIKRYTHNSDCIEGTFLDPVFGDCLKCEENFGCQHCSDKGCYTCENGIRLPNGKCRNW